LAPNCALNTFIEEWCDNNNFKLPKKYNSSRQQTCPIDSKDEIPALVDYFGNLFVLHHFKLGLPCKCTFAL